MRQERKSFVAREPGGTSHIIRVFVDILDVTDTGGPGTIDGQISLQTTDGTPVIRIDKGRYKTLGSDVEFTSTDPNAP
jgi:hypothetical protein